MVGAANAGTRFMLYVVLTEAGVDAPEVGAEVSAALGARPDGVVLFAFFALLGGSFGL